MAINPVIPRGLLNDPCNVDHIKQWRSYEPAILYLQYTLTKPTLVPRFKMFRGEWMECGYTTKWPTLNCIRQIEPGPSIYHSFNLGTLAPGTKIWYRVTTDCNPANPISFSPPIEYVIPPCSTVGTFCKLQRITNSPSSNPVTCVMTSLVAGDPTMFSVALGGIVLGPTGLWQGYAYGRIENILGNLTIPTTFEVFIDGFLGDIPEPKVSVQLVRNQMTEFVVNFTYQKTTGINRTLRLGARRVGTPAANVRFNLTANVPAVLTAIKSA